MRKILFKAQNAMGNEDVSAFLQVFVLWNKASIHFREKKAFLFLRLVKKLFSPY